MRVLLFFSVPPDPRKVGSPDKMTHYEIFRAKICQSGQAQFSKVVKMPTVIEISSS